MATARSSKSSNLPFKLIGPQGAEWKRREAMLSCRLSPEVSAVDMEIRWFKGTDCVCLYKNGQVTEGSGYEGRVNLSTQMLESGNVSLHLRDLGGGDYLCQVTNGDRTEELTVAVEEPRLGLWTVHIKQKNREWTKGERMKMKQSFRLTEYVMLKGTHTHFEETKTLLALKDSQLIEKDEKITEKDKMIMEKDTLLKEKTLALQKKDKELEDKETLLRDLEDKLQKATKKVENVQKDLKNKDSRLQWTTDLMNQHKSDLEEHVKELEEKTKSITERDKQIEENKRLLEELNKQVQESRDQIPSVRRRRSMDQPSKMSGEGSVPELRLVLLGTTGSGKSAAGSVILGREETSQTDTSTERQQSESRQGEVAGRQVTVVDTPDWFCPGLSLEELRKDVRHCVRLSAPGPHAFLLVLPVKQSTGEEIGMLEKMEEIFGERCWSNTIILFTVTDEVQENAEEFIRSETQEVQRLVEKCGNRFHCLNIKENGDGSHVSKLLERIDDMLTENREEIYSSEIYLETESQIREMEKQVVSEVEKMKASEEDETREKLKKSLQQSLKKFTESTVALHKKIDEHEARISELSKQLEEEKDKNRQEELERQLESVKQEKEKVDIEFERLKDEKEKEKSEMDEKHKQEMEKITEKYEIIETENNIMKKILSELQQRLWTVFSKKQKEFDCRLDEQKREMERLKEQIRKILLES